MPDTETKPPEEKPEERKPEEPAKPQEPTEPEKPTGKDGTEFDPERAQRALESAREAEKKAKDEARDLREKAKKWDDAEAANQTELEKAQTRAEKAEAKASDADSRLKRANLIAALSEPKFGIVNARAAAKLIEGVEYDDEGEPTNIGSIDEDDSLIAKFLTENEYLRGKAQKPAAPQVDGAAGQETSTPALTAEELRAAEKYGMSAEEYAVYKNGGSLADLEKAGLAKDEKK